ncbi:uncharacterized protein TNCV_983061 [Trichonephila clavipes]|nr:uncharacterized protein TNCV_983061 [Trichonephila clavipes]
MTTTGMRLPTVSNRPQDFKNAIMDGNRCRRLSGFKMLTDEIVTSVQAESDPVDAETDDVKDQYEGSNKCWRVFCVTGSYGVVQTIKRMLSTTAAQENQRPCSGKTKVYNGTVKNK